MTYFLFRKNAMKLKEDGECKRIKMSQNVAKI